MSKDCMGPRLALERLVALLEPPSIIDRQPYGEVGALFVIVTLQHLAMLIEPGDVAAAIVAQAIGRDLPVARQALLDLDQQPVAAGAGQGGNGGYLVIAPGKLGDVRGILG